MDKLSDWLRCFCNGPYLAKHGIPEKRRQETQCDEIWRRQVMNEASKKHVVYFEETGREL
ncbi:MAG: hypothetical protein FWD46_09085 [Cystobacterineae bacterium]|nr:hypothetical protein [Cystobacterineae bacterium]